MFFVKAIKVLVEKAKSLQKEIVVDSKVSFILS